MILICKINDIFYQCAIKCTTNTKTYLALTQSMLISKNVYNLNIISVTVASLVLSGKFNTVHRKSHVECKGQTGNLYVHCPLYSFIHVKIRWNLNMHNQKNSNNCFCIFLVFSLPDEQHFVVCVGKLILLYFKLLITCLTQLHGSSLFVCCTLFFTVKRKIRKVRETKMWL